MSRDPDERVERVREIADAALDDLNRFLGDAATVDDLRHLWNRLLQPEDEGQLGDAGRISAKGKIASELVMAALEDLVETPDAAPSTNSESPGGTAEPPIGVDPALLEVAVLHQASAAAVRDALVTAQAEIAPLEAELNRAKVRFGNAIRRLYQGGASVSTIAEAMGMSEDAVDEVVGTPISNEYQPVLACSFCATNRKRLIAGPGVYICSECVEIAHEVGARGRKDPFMVREPADSDGLCSFCGKHPRHVRFIVAAEGERICDECLDLCAEILAEKLGP